VTTTADKTVKLSQHRSYEINSFVPERKKVLYESTDERTVSLRHVPFKCYVGGTV